MAKKKNSKTPKTQGSAAKKKSSGEKAGKKPSEAKEHEEVRPKG